MEETAARMISHPNPASKSLCDDCVNRGSCSLAESLSRLSVPLRSSPDPFQSLVTKLVTNNNRTKHSSPNKLPANCSFYSPSPSPASTSCTSYYSCCKSSSSSSTWFHPDSLQVKLCQENCPFHLQKSFGLDFYSTTFSYHSLNTHLLFLSSLSSTLLLVLTLLRRIKNWSLNETRNDFSS